MPTNTGPAIAAYNLTGQVAIVTGGGRGLGQAFAQALATAGAAVAITARTESQLLETVGLIEGKGGTVIAFASDVADQPAMQQVVAEVERQLGPVDLLVNNAATAGPLGCDWQVDPDEWWSALEVNLRAPFLCTRLVLPGMMARRRGRIINVTSVGAYGLYPYFSAYCASKAALSHMTRLLAETVKEHGLSAFALAPHGPTAMIEAVATSPNVPTEVSARFRQYREGGEGDIEQSANMLLFLVSGQADALTGRHIDTNDSIEDLQRRTAQIVQNDSYVLRRHE